MKRKKLPVGELLRLACIYAESDRLEYIDAWRKVDDEEGRAVRQEALDFVAQLREYRKRRWGKTQLESACDSMTEVPVAEVIQRMTESGL